MYLDDFAPLTSRIGFIKASIQEVKNVFVSWMNEVLRNLNASLAVESVRSDLSKLAVLLEPLSIPLRTKYLFAEAGDDWVAYFDNSAQGSDASTVISVLAERVQSIGVVACYIPHTMPRKVEQSSRGQFGAVIFEYFDHLQNINRSIFTSHDGSKWIFGESGRVLPFEKPDTYKTRLVRERFTAELLEAYMKELGVDWRNPDFYRQSSGFVIHRKGAFPPNQRYLSLQEVQASIGMAK